MPRNSLSRISVCEFRFGRHAGGSRDSSSPPGLDEDETDEKRSNQRNNRVLFETASLSGAVSRMLPSGVSRRAWFAMNERVVL